MTLDSVILNESDSFLSVANLSRMYYPLVIDWTILSPILGSLGQYVFELSLIHCALFDDLQWVACKLNSFSVQDLIKHFEHMQMCLAWSVDVHVVSVCCFSFIFYTFRLWQDMVAQCTDIGFLL